MIHSNQLNKNISFCGVHCWSLRILIFRNGSTVWQKSEKWQTAHLFYNGMIVADSFFAVKARHDERSREGCVRVLQTNWEGGTRAGTPH